MLEVTCDRCNRTWYAPFEEGDEWENEPHVPSLTLMFRPSERSEVKVEFESLCESCTKTLSNYIGQLTRGHRRGPGAKKERRRAPSPEGSD